MLSAFAGEAFRSAAAGSAGSSLSGEYFCENDFIFIDISLLNISQLLYKFNH